MLCFQFNNFEDLKNYLIEFVLITEFEYSLNDLKEEGKNSTDKEFIDIIKKMNFYLTELNNLKIENFVIVLIKIYVFDGFLFKKLNYYLINMEINHFTLLGLLFQAVIKNIGKITEFSYLKFKEYLNVKNNSFNIFRGSRMDQKFITDLINKIKENSKHKPLIFFNNFVSASRSETKAKRFTNINKDDSDYINNNVLYEINISLDKLSKIDPVLAFIEDISTYDEEEVIFSSCCIFKINSIKEINNNLYYFNLEYLYNGSEENEYLNYTNIDKIEILEKLPKDKLKNLLIKINDNPRACLLSIEISNNIINQEIINLLQKIFNNKNNRLNMISIKNCDIDDSCNRKLLEMTILKENKFEKILLKNNKINRKSTIILKNHDRDEYYNTETNQYSYDDNSNIKISSNLENSNSFKKIYNLKELDLSFNKIGNTSLFNITEYLKGPNNLKEINLEKNKFNYKGFEHLADLLINNKSYKHKLGILNISNNSLSEGKIVYPLLVDILFYNNHLVNLKMNSCNIPYFNSNYQKLRKPLRFKIEKFERILLDNNSLGDEGLKNILYVINSYKNLTKLSMKNNNITNIGLKYFQELDVLENILENNSIGEKLEKYSKENYFYINFSNNKITLEGFNKFIDYLKMLTREKHLLFFVVMKLKNNKMNITKNIKETIENELRNIDNSSLYRLKI